MIKIDIDCTEFPSGNKYNHPDVKRFLEKAHNKKCCYCETYMEGTVEHFRSRSLYTWLINDCENLLWACPRCNSTKRDKLPVIKKIAEEGDDVSVCDEKEELLMLNPARDNSDWKINFTKTGVINSDNSLMNNTINICNLNRDYLIDERIKIIKSLQVIINNKTRFTTKKEILQTITDNFINPLKNDKELNYIAFRKYIVKNWLNAMIPYNNNINAKHKYSTKSFIYSAYR